MKVDNPDDVRITLTITMTRAQWGVVRDGFSATQTDNHEIIELRSAIFQALRRIEERVSSEPREISR